MVCKPMRGAAFSFLFVFALFGCASEPPNLGDLKTQIIQYQAFGQYDRDFDAVMTKAQDYLADAIPESIARGEKPAVVLDIDETSLSNWPELIANDFAFRTNGPCEINPDNDWPQNPCGLMAWEATARAKGFPATVQLYHFALAHGATVFFLTGRDESVRAATQKNLRAAGYDQGWAEVIMRPHGTHTKSAADYKAPQRARIESMGYVVLANLGDQPSDLAGGHARREFLVPDPFYRIP